MKPFQSWELKSLVSGTDLAPNLHPKSSGLVSPLEQRGRASSPPPSPEREAIGIGTGWPKLSPQAQVMV